MGGEEQREQERAAADGKTAVHLPVSSAARNRRRNIEADAGGSFGTTGSVEVRSVELIGRLCKSVLCT